MRNARQTRRWLTLFGVVALLTSVLVGVSSAAGAARRVRGFDGSTVTVAGYGLKAQLPGAEWGAKARIQQFNDSNELKGVKIKFLDFVDDGQDPATTLSAVRKLVTSDQVFALTPDVSLNTPGDYLTQQHVPNFGGGFSAAYCSKVPTKKLWMFGFNGCQVSPYGVVTGDTEAEILKYVQQKTGKQKPTVAFVTQDDSVGHTAATLFRTQFEGNPGWGKIVGSVENVPTPPVPDVTPFVQKLLTMDNGKPPDFIRCGIGLDCLPMLTRLRAGGFTGPYEHNLYTDALVAGFKDSLVANPFTNLNATGNPSLEQLKTSMKAVKPDYPLDSGVLYGYMSTDMFISALKTAAKKGTSGITPENVQKAAATQTWEIKGLAGPAEFPASTLTSTPVCREIVLSDGTKWNTVEPYTCNKTKYKVK